MPENQEKPAPRRLLPRSVYNPVSLTGAALAVSVTFAIMLIIVVDATSKVHNPYVGIIGFAILPIPLIIGLSATS